MSEVAETVVAGWPDLRILVKVPTPRGDDYRYLPVGEVQGCAFEESVLERRFVFYSDGGGVKYGFNGAMVVGEVPGKPDRFVEVQR